MKLKLSHYILILVIIAIVIIVISFQIPHKHLNAIILGLASSILATILFRLIEPGILNNHLRKNKQDLYIKFNKRLNVFKTSKQKENFDLTIDTIKLI